LSVHERVKKTLTDQLRMVENDLLDKTETWEDTLRLRGTRDGLIFALSALREANKDSQDDGNGAF